MHTIDIIFLLYGLFFFFFFFNDTATTEIYTLSLHDALPIWGHAWLEVVADTAAETKHAVADIINVMLEELVHRSEEHTSELQSHSDLVCRLLLEKKKKKEPNTVIEQSSL